MMKRNTLGSVMTLVLLAGCGSPNSSSSRQDWTDAASEGQSSSGSVGAQVEDGGATEPDAAMSGGMEGASSSGGMGEQGGAGMMGGGEQGGMGGNTGGGMGGGMNGGMGGDTGAGGMGGSTGGDGGASASSSSSGGGTDGGPAVGDPCTADSECPAGGSGTTQCLQDWAGGYCAVVGCEQHGHDCPNDPGLGGTATTGGKCVLAPTAMCLALCETNANCRDGYLCTAKGDAAGHGSANVCFPQ